MMRRFLEVLLILALIGWKIGLLASLSGGWPQGRVRTGIEGTSAAASMAGGGGEPCRIKGNISASGERIYHLPGDRYYAAARIDRWKGERWFCSEEEAERAGFRRARS